MQTRYSYRKPRAVSPGRRMLVFVSLLAMGILIVDIASQGALRSYVRGGTGFVYARSSSLVANVSQSGFLSSKSALAKDNVELRREIAALIGERAAYQAVKAENEALRAFVGVAQNEAGITAPVLSSIRSSAYGTFTIGAGLRDGINQGDLVLTSQGFVLGTITDPGSRNSTVTALFAPNINTDVRIKNAHVAAEGRGGFNARAEVPREIEVAVGDPVFGSITNRPVGVVGAVETSPAAASSDVYIRLPVDVGSLVFVYVVSNSNQ